MKNILIILIVAVIMAAPSALAILTFPNPLTYDGPNSQNIVGTKNGEAGNTAKEEAGFAQILLDMAANKISSDQLYRTTTTEYVGTINTNPDAINQVENNLSDPTDLGYDYALAKYDGKQAGYVLFYLGGQQALLPKYSYNFWSIGEQYAISHYTLFKSAAPPIVPVPEPSTIIVGFGLLLLFVTGNFRAFHNKRAV